MPQTKRKTSQDSQKKRQRDISSEPYLIVDLYRHIVEAAPNAVVVVDREDAIILVNAQTVALFGYRHEELIGRKVETLISERFRRLKTQYRKTFTDDPTFRAMGVGCDLFGLRIDGSKFPIEISLTPLRMEKGHYVLVSIIDITERRKSEEQFRIVVEAAPNAILMVNEDGDIGFANQQAERLFGYTREELMGQKIEILVPERFHVNHPSHRDRFYRDPKPQAMGAGRDLYGLRKDRTEIPIEIGLNPIEMSNGLFALASIIDITERKKAEAKQQDLMALLVSVNAELKEFAYAVSHDLKEPLRGIDAIAGWIIQDQRDRVDDQGKRHLDMLKSRVRRMQSLVDGMLEYSRIGRVYESFLPNNTNELIKEIIDLIAPPPHITIEVQKGLPTLYAERTRIHQLFQNLLTNAIKFIDKKQGRIQIVCADKGDKWQFSVVDNGLGISEQHYDKIFNLFRTLSAEYGVENTGIGLALVKKIVELYGGGVWVESTLGEGTTFFFTFPKNQGRNKQEEKNHEGI